MYKLPILVYNLGRYVSSNSIYTLYIGHYNATWMTTYGYLQTNLDSEGDVGVMSCL